jgi:Tetratricopeptide repeat
MRSELDLDVVGVIEGTDKSSSFSFSWDYLRHYEKLFRRFREEPINFIEIGVAGGASLKVWKALFTHARIVGIDIAPHCARFADERVSIEVGSQDDPEFLARVCAKYPPSIIIDDGSHRGDHVIYTFERMFPSLLPGGIYVVEDLAFHFGGNADNWKGFAEESPPDYFLRMARSCLAGSVQGVPDAGTARYTRQKIDSIEFVRSAVAIHKVVASRNVSSALDFADEYLGDRKPDAHLHERLAQFIVRHAGPLDRAEAELKRAIEIGEETPFRLRMRSDICLRQHRLAEAAAMAERAASLSGDAHAWMHAGHLLTQHGDHAAAVRAYRQAVAMQPGNSGFAAKLSEALERQGDLAEALEAARQSLTAAAGTAAEVSLRVRVNQLHALVSD